MITQGVEEQVHVGAYFVFELFVEFHKDLLNEINGVMSTLDRFILALLVLLRLLTFVLFRPFAAFLFFRVLFAKDWFLDRIADHLQALWDFSLEHFLFSYFFRFGLEELAYLI